MTTQHCAAVGSVDVPEHSGLLALSYAEVAAASCEGWRSCTWPSAELGTAQPQQQGLCPPRCFRTKGRAVTTVLSQGDCGGCVVNALLFHPMPLQWRGDGNSCVYLHDRAAHRDIVLVTGPCALLCPSLFLLVTFQS